MKAYVGQLERLIGREQGQPVIANQYFQWYGFGVMGQVAFSKDFSMLRNTQWRPAIRVIRDGLALLGPYRNTLGCSSQEKFLAVRASEEHVSHTQYYTHTNRKLII